ncbi:MAG: protein-disulfide reductase DsbD N-terminal domain-containing protein [Acidobacteriota bacterium]
MAPLGALFLAAALLSLPAPLMPRACSQQIEFGLTPAAHHGHVELLSDNVQAIAGAPQVVQLWFRVDDGFHINSHAPKDQLMIPTRLELESAGGVKVIDEQYPAGAAFRLKMGEGELLSVYQGRFPVSVRLVAPSGESTLNGVLHYQACGNASCYPPQSLPVRVALSGQ